MEFLASGLKAFFLISVPVTLAVYACVYVGARSDRDLAPPPKK